MEQIKKTMGFKHFVGLNRQVKWRKNEPIKSVNQFPCWDLRLIVNKLYQQQVRTDCLLLKCRWQRRSDEEKKCTGKVDSPGKIIADRSEKQRCEEKCRRWPKGEGQKIKHSGSEWEGEREGWEKSWKRKEESWKWEEGWEWAEESWEWEEESRKWEEEIRKTKTKRRERKGKSWKREGESSP